MDSCLENSIDRGPWWAIVQFSLVQSISHVQLCDPKDCSTPDTSLSIANSWSLLKLMSTESVMPSNRLFLCLAFLVNSRRKQSPETGGLGSLLVGPLIFHSLIIYLPIHPPMYSSIHP